MAKYCSNGMIDGGLTARNASTRQAVLSAQPTSIADITTYLLASVAVSSGDFTNAAGDTSGRKSTIAQKTGVSIIASGTATHVSLDDGTNLEATTCTNQALTSGGTVTIPTWKREINAPT